MAKDVSIVFKASDNLSDSISKMKKNVKDLSRDVTEYRKIQDEAFNKKAEVKLDIAKAKRELAELTKAVKQNKEGSEEAFKNKSKEIEQMQEEYRRLTKVVKEASKAEKDLDENRSRISNKNASRNDDSVVSGILKPLAGAGLGKMLGESIGNYAGQTLTSAYGDKIGNAIGGTVSGALTGAAIGSVAGPIGTAIGAGVGAVSGMINAATEENKKSDDFFKTEVKSVFDTVKENQNKGLQNGIPLASNREQNMISFSTLLSGDKNASKFLSDTERFSEKTPFEQDDLLNISKKLLTFKYKQNEIIPAMTKIGDAGSALGISSEGQSDVATALGRMKSSGKTSLENINILQDKGIDAIGYLAKAMKTTNKRVYEMISKNAIDGAQAANVILNEMGKQFAGNMEKQSATYAGLMSTLDDLKAKADRAEGEGYTKERKKGIEEEIKYRESIGIKDRELIGQYKASLDNKQDEFMRNAIKNAKESDSYIKAQKSKDGAEMGKILMKAETDAMIAFRDSPEMLQRIENERQIVDNIQETIRSYGTYVRQGQKAAEDFSRGWRGSLKLLPTLEPTLPPLPSTLPPLTPKLSPLPSTLLPLPKKHATGLNRVPYDDYLMLAHEGERVLTRNEADKQDNNKSNNPMPNISIVVNNYSGNVIDITREICSQIWDAAQSFSMGGTR